MHRRTGQAADTAKDETCALAKQPLSAQLSTKKSEGRNNILMRHSLSYQNGESPHTVIRRMIRVSAG